MASLIALSVAGNAIGDPARAPAGVSPTGQPARVVLRGRDYVVTGYRSARFGMDADQVVAAIEADFGRDVPIGRGFDPAEKTRHLTTVANGTEASDVPALVTYVFGATTQRLIAVNVYRETATEAPPDERQRIVEIASREAAEFLGYSWQLFSTAIGKPLGPGTLIVFAGADEASAGVEVRLGGADYEVVAPDGSRSALKAPPGPTTLRVAYVQSVLKPDIVRLPPGSF